MTTINRFSLFQHSIARLVQRLALTISLSLGLAGSVTAQTQNRAQLLKDAATASATLFTAKNVAQAEQILFAANRSSPATLRGQVEAAHSLLRVALVFTNRGDTQEATNVARRALHYLDQAIRGAGPQESGLAASAQDLAGYIYERYLGDTTAAKASYRAALLLDPNHGPAKESSARLERSDAPQKDTGGR